MRRSLSAALGAVLVLGAGTAAAVPRDPRLRHVHSWAFAIGDGNLSGNLVARYSAYDLVVLDGEGARRRDVAALHRAGKLVLAYLDVGTIEPGRSWYPTLKPFRLDWWPDWGEWYANLSAAGFRRAIARAIAPGILRKGFDGLFLDNTDMIESHPRQTSAMRKLVTALAALVHRQRGLLFAQNGEQEIGPLLPYYDGWNREDVSATYDFGSHRYVRQPPAAVKLASAALRWIGRAGLLTLATDYVAVGDRSTARTAVANACAAGAVPFLSDINLTRIPAVAARCG